MAEQQTSAYPVQFSVDYPENGLDRLSTLFRLITAIPIAIVAALIGGTIGLAGAWLMILFRQKYPRWWFDWNLELIKFENRVWAYVFLLRDEYPSTDEEQAVHLECPYPDAEQDLHRLLPLVKWFLAIPHFVVLPFLYIVAWILIVISWFAILFTGRYPRSLFDYVVGTMRWTNRVAAYAFMLVTDRYPPFRLSA